DVPALMKPRVDALWVVPETERDELPHREHLTGNDEDALLGAQALRERHRAELAVVAEIRDRAGLRTDVAEPVALPLDPSLDDGELRPDDAARPLEDPFAIAPLHRDRSESVGQHAGRERRVVVARTKILHEVRWTVDPADPESRHPERLRQPARDHHLVV